MGLNILGISYACNRSRASVKNFFFKFSPGLESSSRQCFPGMECYAQVQCFGFGQTEKDF
jgi:hypothetical protein